MSEPTHDPLVVLDDYTSRAMPEAEADAFEEELFGRAASGEAPEAEFSEGLRRAAEWIGRRGAFNVGSTRAEVDQLLASGLRVEYRDFGDGSVPAEIPPIPADIDLYVYRVGVDLGALLGAEGLATLEGVDVVLERLGGEHIKTFRDVRFDPADRAFYGVCERPLAELAFRSGPIRAKLVVHSGKERRLLATLETRVVD
jgi:hypothetical protein